MSRAATFLRGCLRPSAARASPEVAAATAHLLSTAAQHHPSLVDLLCFPTSLTAEHPAGKVGMPHYAVPQRARQLLAPPSLQLDDRSHDAKQLNDHTMVGSARLACMLSQCRPPRVSSFCVGSKP